MCGAGLTTAHLDPASCGARQSGTAAAEGPQLCSCLGAGRAVQCQGGTLGAHLLCTGRTAAAPRCNINTMSIVSLLLTRLMFLCWMCNLWCALLLIHGNCQESRSEPDYPHTRRCQQFFPYLVFGCQVCCLLEPVHSGFVSVLAEV